MTGAGGEAADNLIPELEALLKLWRGRYGARPLSKRIHLTAEDLRPWSRNISFIELGANGRFYARTFGIDLIRRFGRESTGQCIDDLAPDIRENLNDFLQHSLLTGEAVVARSSVKLGRDVAQFNDLAVPIVWSAGCITTLLLASYEIR